MGSRQQFKSWGYIQCISTLSKYSECSLSKLNRLDIDPSSVGTSCSLASFTSDSAVCIGCNASWLCTNRDIKINKIKINKKNNKMSVWHLSYAQSRPISYQICIYNVFNTYWKSEIFNLGSRCPCTERAWPVDEKSSGITKINALLRVSHLFKIYRFHYDVI